MSNTFKRPMFRKGGDVGGGIMSNVVERGQYANSNADDLNVKDVGVKLSDSIDTIMEIMKGWFSFPGSFIYIANIARYYRFKFFSPTIIN